MPRTLLDKERHQDQELAELIRRYKYGKQLTNESLGKAIKVSPSTVRNYLREPRKIPLGKLREIRKVLGIPAEEMGRVLL